MIRLALTSIKLLWGQRKSKLKRVNIRINKVIFKKYFIYFYIDEVHQIYNGNDYQASLKQLTDLQSAHNFAQSCYALIGIHGKFLTAFPIPLTIDVINREIMSSMPYWLVLKFNTEYALLDKQISSAINA